MISVNFTMPRVGMPGIEAVAARTRHAFARHTHENFGIGLIFQGAQKSLSGRGMVEAGRGDTITVNPGEVHDGLPIGGTERAWNMLYFAPTLIAQTLLDLSEGKSTYREFSFPVIRDTAIARRFQRLYTALTSRSEEQSRIEQEESLVVLLAAVMHERHTGDEGDAVPSAIHLARCRIDDDPLTPVTLADLAVLSGLSQFQLVRGFAKATGLTPHAYLVQQRISIARRLIASGRALAEVAASTGFADQSHMTRIFVRKYGVSPGAYADAVI
jgi:AraC-like DNA-binding protein